MLHRNLVKKTKSVIVDIRAWLHRWWIAWSIRWLAPLWKKVVRKSKVRTLTLWSRGGKEGQISWCLDQLGWIGCQVKGCHGWHQGWGRRAGATHGEGHWGLKGNDPRPLRGHAKLISPWSVTRGAHGSSRQGLVMISSLGSKVEALMKENAEMR